jgi:hypothetical protein
MALGLAAVVVAIGIASARIPGDWMSPGVLILPILAGGLLLWPRALRILFCITAVMVAYDWMANEAGLGIVATIVATAIFADVLSRTRAKLGLRGLRGDQMLIELRDRLRQQSTIPNLPDGWHAVSVLRPAGGSSFGGDFLVSVCDGKMLEVALVDVPGKGIEAATTALLLSGAFGGLLGSVPQPDFLPSCNAFVRRGRLTDGFVTAVHLSVDLVTGEFVVASAGHPPAAKFDAGSGQWRLVEARGIVLGVLPELRMRQERGLLRPGDALMLYTDGLIEGRGLDIDVGIDRLLGAADHMVAEGFQAGAVRLVRSMQGAGPRTDDCALAVVWRS